MSLLDSVRCFLPESVLILEALIILVVIMLKGRRFTGWLALMGLIVAFFTLKSIRFIGASGGMFEDIITLDRFAIFFKGLAIAVTFITILFTLKFRPSETLSGEYYCILLLSAVGMCLLASANDLLMAYIALETVSISSYVLTSFLKGNRKSSEAGLKYVIYGAIASGVMIYGMSLLYGLTGQTNFTALSQVIQTSGNQPLLLVIVVLIFAGFGYKIAAVPFHMWCPDVYEGAPTPITAFLSVGPKAVGFAILIRFCIKVFGLPAGAQVEYLVWQIPLAVLCVLTMTVGNLGALKQTNLKRLLAYSGIAHCGYILMGVVAASPLGLEAVLVYFLVYLFMNLGAFLVVIAVSESIGREEISDYRGLGWRLPFPAVIMSIFLFSLTGLPPLAGFVGKFYLFKAVIVEPNWWWLALVGAINTVISLYYYARVVKAMFLEQPLGTTPTQKAGIPLYYSILLFILASPIVVWGVYWVGLARLAQTYLSILR